MRRSITVPTTMNVVARPHAGTPRDGAPGRSTTPRTTIRALMAAIASITLLIVGLATPAAAATAIATATPTKVTVEAPAAVKAGSKAAITVTTDGDYTGKAVLWHRSASEWTKSSMTINITDGIGKASWTPTKSLSYRIEVSGAATSKAFTISLTDSIGRNTTANFSTTTYASGEMGWIKGYARKYSTGIEGAALQIERAPRGTTTWSAYATTTTRDAGYYSLRFVPSSKYAYRVRIKDTSAVSGPITIAHTSNARTLESRAASLAWIAGKATTGIGNVPSGRLPKGVQSARYQSFERGMLVEVVRDGLARTWYTYDRIGDTYKSKGGWESKLGLPMRDLKCNLMEKGCVQRFTGGSLYQNNTASSPKVYVAYGSVVETEIIAVAKSQVGFRETKQHVNKYNTWVGATNAWCSVFMGWSAAASGNSTMIPKRKSFASYLSTLKDSGVLKYSGTPPVGAVVLFDWGSGTPSHTAIVRGHDGTSILTVEGNTSDGKDMDSRGVFERSRLNSWVWAWYWPHEYAAR